MHSYQQKQVTALLLNGPCVQGERAPLKRGSCPIAFLVHLPEIFQWRDAPGVPPGSAGREAAASFGVVPGGGGDVGEGRIWQYRLSVTVFRLQTVPSSHGRGGEVLATVPLGSQPRSSAAPPLPRLTVSTALPFTLKKNCELYK